MSQKTNPWTKKSTKLVYDNPWISVEHHEVTTPSGSDGIYGKIKFKNLAIGVIPVDEAGYTWLVGQYRYTLDTYSWEIPMGGGPIDSDPLSSAKRELQEETGLSAASWTKLMTLHTSNSVTDEVGIVYLAQGLSMGTTSLDDTEQITVKKIKISEAIDMALNGEITDAISVSALLRYKLSYMT